MNSQMQNNMIKSPIKLKKINSFFSQKKQIKNINKKKPRSLSFISNNKEKVKIIWSEGGKKIYLTGSFCQWNKLYLMNKDNKEELYYIILFLPKGFHQFKFNVDGKWKLSSIYPQYNTNGNVNNYIDNINSTYDNTSASTVESSVLSSNDNKKNVYNFVNNVNNNFKIDLSYSKKNYCNYYPKKKEMKEHVDKKPHYFQIECYHGVNQAQNNIGNKKFLCLVDRSIFSGNNSYKEIEKKDHILLNHFCNRQIKNDTFISSVPIKYRHKNITFLYYK